MEISYYYECFTYKAKYVPKCLEADFVSAKFVFDLEFLEDYKNISSAESKKLLSDIIPLIRKSFGGIDVDLSKIRIEEGSVQLLVEIKLIRNSVSDIESLLNNHEDACRKFLGKESIDSVGDKCWYKNTEKIFEDEGYTFVDLEFTGSDEAAVLTIVPSSIAEQTVTTESLPNLTTTPSTIIDSRTPDDSNTVKSTQSTTETSRTTEKIKTTSRKNEISITQTVLTTPSTTNYFRTLISEITAPKSDFLSTSTSVRQDSSEPNNDEVSTSSSMISTSLTSSNIGNCYFTETENSAVFETGNPYNINMRLRFLIKKKFSSSYFVEDIRI